MKSSVPPWKSMPSRKPRVTIDTMPGTMMIREIRKKMFRRPTMSSRRAGRARCWTCSAATPSAGGLSSATLHSEHADAPRPAEVEHDRQQVVRDDDRRDQADGHADRQRDGEAADRPRPRQDQDAAGDQRRDVRVADGGPRPPDGGVDRGPDR